jgi:type II secretory pathway component GspD/PulD (secretin)
MEAPMHHVSLLLSTLVLVGCWSAPPSAAAQDRRGPPSAEPAFPLPRAPFVVPGGEQANTTLAMLVDGFSEATGVHFVTSKEAQQVLQVSRTGLTRTLEVAPDRAWELFETLLIESDFAIAPLMRGEPAVFGLYSLNTQARNSLRDRTVSVAAADVEAYARHPALLVTTVVELPSTDVRTLSNSMRTMFTDANTQQIIPVGTTSSLVITGFGSNVASIVRMLKRIDEATRLELERTPKREPTPPPVEKPPEAGKQG